MIIAFMYLPKYGTKLTLSVFNRRHQRREGFGSRMRKNTAVHLWYDLIRLTRYLERETALNYSSQVQKFLEDTNQVLQLFSFRSNFF